MQKLSPYKKGFLKVTAKVKKTERPNEVKRTRKAQCTLLPVRMPADRACIIFGQYDLRSKMQNMQQGKLPELHSAFIVPFVRVSRITQLSVVTLTRYRRSTVKPPALSTPTSGQTASPALEIGTSVSETCTAYFAVHSCKNIATAQHVKRKPAVAIFSLRSYKLLAKSATNFVKPAC